jgi:hypothetical protein
VVNEFGVFVDATAGNDSNAGTRESPVKSIGAALGKLSGKPRVYICDGTYAEHLKLTSAVSLFGGFACGAWTYSGNKAKVAPGDKGVALEISNVASSMVIADLDVTSMDAVDPGESSIAVFVANSAGLTLRRFNATAGKGQDATNAAAPPSNLFSEDVGDLLGTGTSTATGGAAKVCACKTYGSSTGGKGGDGGNPAPKGGDGSATPAATVVAPRTGIGGPGYAGGAPCGGGFAGSDGSARAAGTSADHVGALDANGWTPAKGGDGEAGNPGAGGGGGGGGITNGSGGGGCGGCGGSGGLGAAGGGASIAIASLSSSLHLDAVKLQTGDAGKGGDGSTGQGGGGGGGGGAVGACGGGNGGNGAGGGGGGGGAGGVSAGIVRSGGSIDGAPQVSVGAKGAPGSGGTGGAGGTNALGTAPGGASAASAVDGVAEDVLILQ